MDDLDALIGDALDGAPAENTDPTFQITRGTYEKIMAYAKVISKIAGTGMECYGYLIQDATAQDDVITDAYFADNQIASSAYVRVTEEGVRAVTQKMHEQNKKILGWWHSHGTMSTFHSGTDVRNFEVILHSLAPETMYLNGEAQPRFEENKMVLDNYTFEGADVAKLKEALASATIKKKEERDPVAFSMVVNVNKSHYLERITKTYHDDDRAFMLNSPINPELEIIDIENDLAFTIEELEGDARGKISFSGDVEYCIEESSSRTYTELTEAFCDAIFNYLSQGGTQGEKLGMFIFDNDTAKIKTLAGTHENDAQKNAVLTQLTANKQMVVDRLDDYFEEHGPPMDGTNQKNLDYKDFQSLLALQFMVRTAKGGDLDELITKYSAKHTQLKDAYDAAVTATKALTKYAHEEITDYKGESASKHTTLVSTMLKVLSNPQYVSLDAVAEHVVNKGYGSVERVFLHEEKVQIVNQLTRYLYTADEAPQLKGFIDEFSDAYAAGTADTVVENYLLPLKKEEPPQEATPEKAKKKKSFIRRLFGG